LDNAGNRNSKADLYAGVTTNYGYDNIYELLSATPGASTTESYTYDPVGNRLSNLSGSGWSNNTSNELTSRPGVTYTYDNNGNTTSKTDSTGATNYTWDYENRLTSVTLPGSGGTVSFKYDPFGRRIYKSSSSGTSIYAYDSNNLVEETNASGGVAARYSQGLNIDEPLAMLRSSTTSYYQADGLGSVTSLSNGAGALAQNYTYDSFGNIIATTGSLVNSFRYTGREWDTETNLYYYRARYYDQSAGRFVSEDPIQFGGGKNFYRYSFSNPVNFRDPSGLDPSLWQKLLNWLWPSPAPPPAKPPSACPSPGNQPFNGYIPPWIPVKQFNKFNTGPSSGPYRPPNSPQPPEGPINPTEPPPVLDPPPPGGLPETIPPTPFTTSPAPPEQIPPLQAIVDTIFSILNAMSNMSDPIIIIKQCKGCT
jgi:RHS repeat-associated protein